MKTFEKKTLINCRIEELFNFHLNPNNITRITPPNIQVTLLNKEVKPQVGEIVNIKTSKYGIPTSWSVEISLLNEPTIMVDTAKKSPFKFWRHSHIFTQKGNVCELKDFIEYELPFGFLGGLLSGFIQNDLNKMFEYRHQQTKKILETAEF